MEDSEKYAELSKSLTVDTYLLKRSGNEVELNLNKEVSKNFGKYSYFPLEDYLPVTIGFSIGRNAMEDLKVKYNDTNAFSSSSGPLTKTPTGYGYLTNLYFSGKGFKDGTRRANVTIMYNTSEDKLVISVDKSPIIDAVVLK